MHISIISVGRVRKGPERELFDTYAKRLSWEITLAEVEETRPLAPAAKVRREAELLLSRVPKGAVTVALDGRGKALSSEDFAAQLGDWRDQGVSEIAFLIGGADGLAQDAIAQARLVLSMGAMTWPHLMVRAMLAEQIYRAEQILRGHPYHRAGPPPA